MDKDKKRIIFWRFAGSVGILFLTVACFYLFTPTVDLISESRVIESQKAIPNVQITKISKETIVDLGVVYVDAKTEQKGVKFKEINSLPAKVKDRIINKTIREYKDNKVSNDILNNEVQPKDFKME